MPIKEISFIRWMGIIIYFKIECMNSIAQKKKKAMLSVHSISGVRFTFHPFWSRNFPTDHFEVTNKIHPIPGWIGCKIYIQFHVYKKYFSKKK